MSDQDTTATATRFTDLLNVNLTENEHRSAVPLIVGIFDEADAAFADDAGLEDFYIESQQTYDAVSEALDVLFAIEDMGARMAKVRGRTDGRIYGYMSDGTITLTGASSDGDSASDGTAAVSETAETGA